MRIAAPLVLMAALLAAGCASSSDDADQGPTLTADLFPLDSQPRGYAMTRGEQRTLRIESVSPDAATVWFDGGRTPQRLDVVRTAESLRFGRDLGEPTELLRFGATPGTTWRSGPTEVRFDGWERIEVPAGLYDAARVSTSLPEQKLQRAETWWFAPGVGIVRLRSDFGGLFTEEMSLVRP